LGTLEQNSIESLRECIFKEETSAKFTVSKTILNLNIFTFFVGEQKSGFSIYDGEFADESFNVKHEEPGLLGMCKRGGIPHTN